MCTDIISTIKTIKKYFAPIVVLIASIATHFAYFGWPAQVVFDEVHAGFYLNQYWLGKYLFDVHPPLGRLIFQLFGNLFGSAHSVDFSLIGNALPFSVVMLRLVPMIAGTVLPLIVYLILRKLQISKAASMTAGLLIVLENSLVVQSRFILTDSFILLFGFLSLLLYLHFLERTSVREERPHPVRDRGVAWLLSLSAAFAAAAGTVKWTGFSFLLIILILEAIRMYSKPKRPHRSRRLLGFICVYGGILAIVYTAAFAVHFDILPYSGSGDAFMSPQFQKTLIGNGYAVNPSIIPEGFFGKLFETNVEMLHADNTLTDPVQYSSRWYAWPIMLRPIFYWQSGVDASTAPASREYIYLLGNPLIYWLGTASAAAVILYAAARAIRRAFTDRRRRKKDGQPQLQTAAVTGISASGYSGKFIAIGYLMNFLPFIFIGRVMFLYHYESALVFSIMALAWLVDRMLWKKWKAATISVILCICAASFLFFSPLTYGTPLSTQGLQARMWLSSWR